ncbi:hypothetical protein [Celeribacter ethanolicus]|uniref:hypothetical protein n=1 Tax=Celeribacter ethanolicus TaxID=1758178 RepID=UPI00082E6DB3|nr:hypothetical protein [Celeribacter ethanolicus]
MTFNSVKTLTAAALLAVATSGTAFAANMDYNYIVPGEIQSLNSVINLELVRASEAGTVSIYDYSNGTQGALLGTAEVHAGANTNVKVELTPNVAQKALVVLSEEGAPVATTTLRNLDKM